MYQNLHLHLFFFLLLYSNSVHAQEISIEKYSNLSLDFETRAKVSRTRSANFSDDPERNLLLSKRYFQN